MIALLSAAFIVVPASEVMVMPVSAATGVIDPGTQSRLEEIATKVVAQSTGACVVTPAQLRELKRRPDPNRVLCGKAATEVITGPWYFHTKVSRDGSMWRMSAQLLDRLNNVPLGKADVNRGSVTGLLDAAPAMFRAVATSVNDAPIVEGRLIGVVGSVPQDECERHAADTEAIVGWKEPREWFVAEYGKAEALRRARDLAMISALRVATREAVEGGFVWVLAQLSERDRATIGENTGAFELWSTGQVSAGFEHYVIRREVKETREEPDSREARVLVRTCLDTKKIRAEVREELARLRRK